MAHALRGNIHSSGSLMFSGNVILSSPVIQNMGMRAQLLFTHESTPIWHKTLGLSKFECGQLCANLFVGLHVEYRMAPGMIGDRQPDY